MLRAFTGTVTIVICLAAQLFGQRSWDSTILNINWNIDTIRQGLIWAHTHTDQLFDSYQSINMLVIGWEGQNFSFDIVNSDSLMETSRIATGNDALAAINGSFFDMTEGGSTVFFQDEGILRKDDDPETGVTEEAVIAIDTAGQLRIVKRPCQHWEISSAWRDALASGPLLLDNQELQNFSQNGFHQNRHPRTAIGITYFRDIIWITVDGRSNEAAGMRILELAEFMRKLGCVIALNLDGGGSTTMWLNTPFRSGIVNYPSDNGKFDHLGERKVANALVITGPKH
jgi:exopolysaccharide biosynthesis protein